MKKFVEINSKINITVTAGLQSEDLSNPNANIPNRMKINPLWPKLTVDILEGSHWYPSEITEWNTVKALKASKVLFIGEFSDTCEGDPEAQQTKDELKKAIDEVDSKMNKKKKLEEAAE